MLASQGLKFLDAREDFSGVDINEGCRCEIRRRSKKLILKLNSVLQQLGIKGAMY